MHQNGRNGHKVDATILVPPAAGAADTFAPANVAPSPQEIIQMQASILTEQQNQLAQERIAAAQVVHVGIALAALLIQLGHGDATDLITVPVELRDRYEGGHITIGEAADRSYLIRIRTRDEPEDISLAREDHVG